MNRSGGALVPIIQYEVKDEKDRSQKAFWPFPTSCQGHASGGIFECRLEDQQ